MVQRNKSQRLRWLGLEVRMDKNILAFKVFGAVLAGVSRGMGRPSLCWKDLAIFRIFNWYQTAKRKNEWHFVVNYHIIYYV